MSTCTRTTCELADLGPHPESLSCAVQGMADALKPIRAGGVLRGGGVVTAHPKCHTPAGHVCAKPSGRVCIEAGCDAAAGTLWTPLWCPDHDADRLGHISAGLAALTEATP